MDNARRRRGFYLKSVAAGNGQRGVTLLHEMGHTANVPGLKDVPVKPTDAVQNFMLYGDDRTDMLKQQVIAMAKAYFAV